MQCVACKEEIADGADLCSKCGQFQSTWKNTLRFVTTLTGILTILAGVVVFVIDKAPAAFRSAFFDDEIEVLTFASGMKSAIANLGPGTVYVDNVKIRTDHRTAIMNVQESVLPNQVLTINHNTRSLSVVGQITPDKFNAAAGSPCFEVQHFGRDYAVLIEARNAHKDIHEDLGTGTVNYVSLRTGKLLQKQFDTSSVLVKYTGCVDPAERKGENSGPSS